MYLEINGIDLSQRYTYVTLTSTVSKCACTLKAGIVVSDTDPNFAVPPMRKHARVVWKDDEGRLLFVGVLLAYSTDTSGVLLSVTAMDYGYYLAKNEGYYSFSCTPEAAAKQLASDFGIALGEVASTGVTVSRKFPGVYLHNILYTMYTKAGEKTGQRYQIRFEGEALTVFAKSLVAEKTLAAKVNINSASVTVDATDYVNTVEIRSESGKLIRTLGGREDVSGLLQRVITQADGEDAGDRARALLEDGEEQQTVTLECFGDNDLITGNAVQVQTTTNGITGLFWIDAATHTWKNGRHTCKLELNLKNIMATADAGKELT